MMTGPRPRRCLRHRSNYGGHGPIAERPRLLNDRMEARSGSAAASAPEGRARELAHEPPPARAGSRPRMRAREARARRPGAGCPPRGRRVTSGRPRDPGPAPGAPPACFPSYDIMMMMTTTTAATAFLSKHRRDAVPHGKASDRRLVRRGCFTHAGSSSRRARALRCQWLFWGCSRVSLSLHLLLVCGAAGRLLVSPSEAPMWVPAQAPAG